MKVFIMFLYQKMYTDANEIVWSLVTDNNLKVCRLVTGGQEGEFEGRLCVPIEMVKKAAEYYYENGKKCNDYTWE